MQVYVRVRAAVQLELQGHRLRMYRLRVLSLQSVATASGVIRAL